MIHWPANTVFDEVYFGNFTNFYTQNQYFHDIHPPLAKLIMYKIANLSEYDGQSIFKWKPEGHSKPDYVQLRLTPASFSALCIPLVYLSTRFLGFSKCAAFTASYLVLCDTSLAVEGRFILTDGILHFFAMLHVTVLTYTMSIIKIDRYFVFWHILTGITLGCASSIKNTAWGLMVLDAIMYMRYLFPSASISWIAYIFDVAVFGSTLFLINFAVYFFSFAMHFYLLPYAGQGYGYLGSDMRSQLILNNAVNNSLWAKRIHGDGLLMRTIKYTIRTHRGNMGITQFHDSQSYPYNWPLTTGVGTYFYGQNEREVRCLPNAIVYYLAFFGILSIPWNFKSKHFWSAISIFVGYLSCYLPFYLIPRVLYNYHYLIPLMIACIGYGGFLDIYLPRKYRGIVLVLSCFLAFFGFWLWSDRVYALPKRDDSLTFWTKNWIDGDSRHRRERDESRKTSS